MIKYPSVLPGPLLASYALNQQSNLLRTKMDSGQARQRRRFKSVPTIIPSTWIFTAEQAATFEGFIENALLGGTVWFEMPIKTPLGIKTGQLRFVTSPLEDCTALSIQLWQYKANIELKTRHIQTLDETTDAVLAPKNLSKFISDIDMSRYYIEKK